MQRQGIDRRGRGARWFALYSGLFAFGMIVLCLVMVKNGKLLIWQPDGLEQHYTVVNYVGRALRALLSGKRPPMMSFSLGQGMDVLTSCAYYGCADPLNLLAALADESAYGLAYVGISLLRAWLAGLAFALYAKKVGARDSWALGCSAAIYAFSGYFLLLIGRHPYFLNGGLYLPLLLYGVERVLENRRWLVYTLVTALMLMVNFYFAYMNTVVAVLYIVVRLIARLRSRGVAKSAGDGLILLGGYVLGAAMAGVVLIPVAYVFLNSARTGVQTGYSGSMLHYPASFYLELACFAFIGRRGGTLFTCLGFAPLALFGVMGLFTRGQDGPARARQLRVALYLCLVMAAVPLCGKVMNGFAYVTNRWVYAMALFVSLGCCFGLKRLFGRNAPRRAMAVLAMVYAALCAAAIIRWQRKYFLIGAALIAMPAVLIFLWGTGRYPYLTNRRVRRILTAMLAVTLAGNICIDYFRMGGEYVPVSGGRTTYDTVADRAKAPYIEDDGVYRTDQGAYNDANALLLDYMGTSYYLSLVDRTFFDYYAALWLPSLKMSYNYYGFFGNNSMDAVAAVKYFVRGEGDDSLPPYGFTPNGQGLKLKDGTLAQVFENEYALPLGYAFDTRLAERDYDALPVEDKLRALTRTAVVESTDGTGLAALDAAAFAGGAVQLPHRIALADGVELSDGKLRAEAGGTLRLAFEAPEDAVIYLMAPGLRPNRDISNGDYGRLSVVTDQGGSQDVMPTPSSNFYYPKQGSAYCLGYGALDHCELRFENAMSYDCGELRVVALPAEEYRRDMQARRAEAMTDVRLGDDRLTGKIAVSGDRILQIAVPYSRGWRAWVDGVEQPVFRCGGLYMGLALGAGEHEIEMRYVTPGLAAGLALSCAALVMTVALAILSAARRRKERKDA